MKYYYNSYRINWADEANFYGFELISETEIQRRKEICRLAAELGEDCGYRICFGSNEDDDNIDNMMNRIEENKTAEELD